MQCGVPSGVDTIVSGILCFKCHLASVTMPATARASGSHCKAKDLDVHLAMYFKCVEALKDDALPEARRRYMQSCIETYEAEN
jgi:hypothetical protein